MYIYFSILVFLVCWFSCVSDDVWLSLWRNKDIYYVISELCTSVIFVKVYEAPVITTCFCRSSCCLSYIWQVSRVSFGAYDFCMKILDYPSAKSVMWRQN